MKKELNDPTANGSRHSAMTAQDILEKLARIDTEGQSAEHVANLACQYAADARAFLKKLRQADFSAPSNCVSDSNTRKLRRVGKPRLV